MRIKVFIANALDVVKNKKRRSEKMMMTKRSNDLADILRKVPLFSKVELAEVAAMAEKVRELRVERGEILFQKGDQPHGFYVLLEGRITLAFPSEQGTERILEVIKPGETFGEALMFLGQPYPIFSQAGVDSRVLDIPEEAITNLLDKDCRLAKRMLAGISILLDAFQCAKGSLHVATRRSFNRHTEV
jgi:CRP-like cAMP-binding protein